MDFGDYIKSLPNERFEVQNKIRKECGVSMQTLNKWINGLVRPKAEKRKVIAEILGRDELELFPVNGRVCV